MLLVPLVTLAIQASQPTIVPQIDRSFQHPAGLDLTSVTAVFRAQSGELLVIDRRGDIVYRLDPTGNLLPPLATNGAGPGEVDRAIGLGSYRDSVWIVDAALRRISYYSRSLQFMGSQSILDRCGAVPWTISPDGRCVVLLDSESRSPWKPVVLEQPGAGADTLGRLIVSAMTIRYDDAQAHVRQPFADDPIPVYSMNGRYFAWVDQRRQATNGPATARIEMRDLLDNEVRRYSVAFVPQPLTQDSVARMIHHLASSLGPTPFPGFADSVSHRLYRPQWLPAFQAAFLDESGMLWLRQQVAQGSQSARWDAYTTDGSTRKHLNLPANFQLLNATEQHLLGVLLDGDDVPWLTQYSLGMSN